MYAVRIDAPRQYQKNDFTRIEESRFVSELRRITRADVKGGSLSGDQRPILYYITLDGKGAGVFMRNRENKKIEIELTNKGADAIYGIAVGFAHTAELVGWFKDILGTKEVSVNEYASFIIIAPYKELSELCTVSN
jgi:hypothetical protein